jgi:hypothetical protein
MPTHTKSHRSPKSHGHTKSHGQRQQEQSSSSQALPSQVTKDTTKRTRPLPFKERTASNASSPSTPGKSPKKPKTAPSENPGELAGVESLDDTTAVTVVNVTPNTSIENARSTAAQDPVVNVSSSGASIPTDEEQNLTQLHESSSISKKREGNDKDKDAGQNEADIDNSDSSSSDNKSSSISKKRKGKDKDKDAGQNEADINNADSSSTDSNSDSSNDLEHDRPTPVKKQSGIDRLQRGRKIKASSPAGRKYPTRTCFDLLVDFV